jgi:hypothetical protein
MVLASQRLDTVINVLHDAWVFYSDDAMLRQMQPFCWPAMV